MIGNVEGNSAKINRVTVAICTWNRCRILDQTLTALRELEVGDLDWELLVVNNNSTDDTPQVIEKHAEHLPIRGLFEPTAGKSHAANLATREAQGELIIWTDDDVFPVSNWVTSYVEAAERWPDYSVFGGPIVPYFEGGAPPWLARVADQVPNAYGLRDFGPEPIELSHETVPFGANFAVRTEVQRAHAFDPRLGVNGRARVGGYETSVIRQILDSGAGGRWVPEASLRHFVRRETQSIKFLRHYYEAQGRKLAVVNSPEKGATLFGKPRWLLRQALQAELRFRWRRLTRSPEQWIDSLVESSRLWGKVKG